jgi:hypothetical protein
MIKQTKSNSLSVCEISSCYGGEYEVQFIALMMEKTRTSETSVDNYFTRQYIPEDKSEQVCQQIQNTDNA